MFVTYSHKILLLKIWNDCPLRPFDIKESLVLQNILGKSPQLPLKCCILGMYTNIIYLSNWSEVPPFNILSHDIRGGCKIQLG